jgi:hypothetical protein
MALFDLEFDIMLPVQAASSLSGAVTAEQRRQIDKAAQPDQKFGVSSRKLYPDGTLIKNLFTGVDLRRVHPHFIPEAVSGPYIPERRETIFDDLVNACTDYEWLSVSATESGFTFQSNPELAPLYSATTNAVLDNGFVRVEFDNATSMLGVNDLYLGGMQFDPTGNGSYGNRDFSSPGSPFEHWSLKILNHLIGSNWINLLSGTPTTWHVNDDNIVVKLYDWLLPSSNSPLKILLGFYLPSGSKSLYMRMAAMHVPTYLGTESVYAGSHIYMNRYIDPDQGRTYSTPSYDNGGSYYTYNTLTNRYSTMAYEPVSGWTLEVRGCATHPEGEVRPSVRLDWNHDPGFVFEQPSDDAYYTDSTINAPAKIPFTGGVAVYDLVYSFYAMTPELALEA